MISSDKLESWEYAPVINSPQLNYDVISSYQKIIAWWGLRGNGSFLGPFFFNNNVNGMSYLEILNEEILPTLVLLFPDKFNYMDVLLDSRWCSSPLFQGNQPLLRTGILK